MAHYIARKDRIDVDIPLKQWSCKKLIVHFGFLQNSFAYEQWLEWSMQDKKHRGKEPETIIIEFITNDEFERMYEESDFNEKVSDFFG